ncbi:MAG TPA: ABC transporter permease [Firmicutes bacterium]|nr:ABC transporter permease [Bacillota bacterium]
MSSKHILTVWQKEMLDTIRDRRTLLAMVIVPLLLMPAITVGFPVLMERQEEAARRLVSGIAVIGGTNSSILIGELKDSKGIRLIEYADLKIALQAMKENHVQLVVEIPEGFDRDMASGLRPKVNVYYEGTRRTSDIARGRFMDAFSRFSQKVVAKRLVGMHVDPAILVPAEVISENIASEEKMGGLLLSMMLPVLMAIWASIGGMYTAIDVAAGEKERGTLESLIITPPSRESIVLGKFLAVLTISGVTMLLVVSSIVLALRLVNPASLLGQNEARFVLPIGRAAVMFLIGLLLAGLLGAIEITLSIFAKSFKEAQNYITPLYIAVMIPGFLTQITSAAGATAGPFYFAIPVANAIEIFRELLMGSVNWIHIGVAAISSFVYALLALNIAIRIFCREDVIFRS